ncbi:MAG: hypothetical protein K2X98_05005, partial [Alphaproteobacteria bacterium]|nr:hypothetical protein [Alphaproteobacteria bacterium]
GLLEEEDDEWESVNLSDIKKLLLKKYFDYRKAPNPSKMGHAKAYFSGENFKGLEEIIKENNGVYSVEIGADKRYLDRKKAESRQKILDEAIERKRLEQEKKDREALEKQEIDDLEVRLNQKIVWADTLTPEEKIESFCQLSNPSYTPKYADRVKNMIMVKNADIKEVPVQIFVIARDEYKITSGNKPLLSYKFEDPTNKTYYDAIASIPGVKFRLYCMDNNAGIVILRITYDNSRIENRKDSFVILKEGNSGITPVEFEKIKDVILKFEK